MTSEPQPDLEARLRHAEYSLHSAFSAALAGGGRERRRLMAAVRHCRLARLAARGSRAYERKEAAASPGPADDLRQWTYAEGMAESRD